VKLDVIYFHSGDTSYGFIQKVLEGISLRINSISVKFSSAVFKAEFQVCHVFVYAAPKRWY